MRTTGERPNMGVRVLFAIASGMDATVAGIGGFVAVGAVEGAYNATGSAALAGGIALVCAAAAAYAYYTDREPFASNIRTVQFAGFVAGGLLAHQCVSSAANSALVDEVTQNQIRHTHTQETMTPKCALRLA